MLKSNEEEDFFQRSVRVVYVLRRAVQDLGSRVYRRSHRVDVERIVLLQTHTSTF